MKDNVPCFHKQGVMKMRVNSAFRNDLKVLTKLHIKNVSVELVLVSLCEILQNLAEIL